MFSLRNYARLPLPIDLALKEGVHFWEALESGAELIFRGESERLRCGRAAEGGGGSRAHVSSGCSPL